MNDEASSSKPASQRSWLDRLSSALQKEPQDKDRLFEELKDPKYSHLLDADALAMIEGVLDVSEMQVRDSMIPRSHMVVVEFDESPDEFLPKIIASAHSRFPVIGENKDEVIGILLAKDLLRYTFDSDAQFNLKDIIRPAVFVPESKRLDVLLQEFRLKRNHMAIVVDEYGGVAGLVTIEDVLEEIVGEIEDEHDIAEAANIQALTEQQYAVQALTPIEEFNEHFNAQLSDEEFDTIGGLVVHSFGHLPKKDEEVTIGNFHFKVLLADKRRLRLLEMAVMPTIEDE